MELPTVAELDGGVVLLRVLLYLPSRDAFRLTTTCHRHEKLAFPSAAAVDFWSSFLAESAVKGLHSSDVSWLHALVEGNTIAAYSQLAQHFALANELQFNEAADVHALMVGMDVSKKISSEEGGELFAKRWMFDQDDVSEAMSCGSSWAQREILSSPLRLCWMFQGQALLDFELRLKLTFLSGDKCLIAWEPRIVGELNDEERDYIELNVGGTVVTRGEETTVFAIKPFHGTLNTEFDVVSPLEQPSAQVCLGLFHGATLTCAFRVLLKSMGMAQKVTLYTDARDKATCHKGADSPMRQASPSTSPRRTRNVEPRPAITSDDMDAEEMEARTLASQGASGAQPSFHDMCW